MSNLSVWIVIRKLRFPLLVIIVSFSISIIGMMLIPGQDDQGNVYNLNFFDAFYFISYTASTIGFGETPYNFTYPQRLWVSFSLYLTVIGWFYGIGSIIALMQDKVLAMELARSGFIKSVKQIKEPFVLIFGYNDISKDLIKKLSQSDKRVVIVDKNQETIDALKMENYHPFIPCFAGDVSSPDVLAITGIRSKYCQAGVIVFDNDYKNSTVAIKCKYLNKNVPLLVRSSSIENSEYLYSLGLEYVENPFKVISHRLHLAFTAPHLWLLEQWVYGHPLKLSQKDHLPKGKCIIYGYGRMGKALESGLKKAAVEYTFIDAKALILDQKQKAEIYGNDKIQRELIEAGIKEASIIISATRDDMVNLAVTFLAKKLNPHIYTIARENEISDMDIFKLAQIDRNYILEEIVSNKIYNYLAKPLANRFIKVLNSQDETWGESLVKRIVAKMGSYTPALCEMKINSKQAYALSLMLQKKEKITLGMLRRSRTDFTAHNNILFLMLIRDNQEYLIPDEDFEIAIDDELLIICFDRESEADLAYIFNNTYELHYVIYGKEEISGLLGKIFKN